VWLALIASRGVAIARMGSRQEERPVGSTGPAPRPGPGERIARLLLTYSPLGRLVRRVARVRASVHSKLLGAFLLIALLLIALGVPYMLSWIVIGAVFLRGVRAAHEPVRGG